MRSLYEILMMIAYNYLAYEVLLRLHIDAFVQRTAVDRIEQQISIDQQGGVQLLQQTRLTLNGRRSDLWWSSLRCSCRHQRRGPMGDGGLRVRCRCLGVRGPLARRAAWKYAQIDCCVCGGGECWWSWLLCGRLRLIAQM